MSYHNFLIIFSLILPIICHAEITFDNSFGSKIELSGPNYEISEDNGKPIGNNLFHSFETFNINKGESAIFTGTSSIENIISRVTGNSKSKINGLLRSSIPNANFYLLNPNGLFLGKNARLEINGSIYLSSANYLRFSDKRKFRTNSKALIFSSAQPEAFGFFKYNIGEIKINGFDNNGDEIGYSEIVNDGEKLTIIGTNNVKIIDSKLYAPQGNINIVSTASDGEIILSDITENTLTKLGNVEISNGSWLDVNTKQDKSGSVVILGERFFMDNSDIRNSGVTGTGNIEILSEKQLQIGNSLIRISTSGKGNTGDIIIKTDEMTMDKKSSVQVITTKASKGNAGNINIETDKLTLLNGSQLNTSTQGSGNGGEIIIEAKEEININDGSKLANPGGISSSASVTSRGNGGKISINADSLKVDNWATIQTLTKGEGNAGDISINVHDLQITNGADIDASNEGSGTGRAGNIDITANNSVFITATKGIDSENMFVVKDGYLGGIYSSANKQGTGGDIELSTKYLTMRNGSVISVGSEGIKEGNAGNINLNIGSKFNMDNAAILTKSQQAGGDISIKNPDFFTVNKSQILANANNKDGGNIRIIAEQFIKSSDSFLDASSELGIDGSVQIDAPQTNIGDELVVLPRHLLRARLQEQCATLLREDESHFVRVNWLGVPRDELEGGVLGSHHDLEPKQ